LTALKGRLKDGKKAQVELMDRELKLTTGGGFLWGKPLVKTIPLDTVRLVERREGEKPYPEDLMLKLVYEEGDLVFFSPYKEDLTRIADAISKYVDKRAKIIASLKEEFNRDRETHLALLLLGVELLDTLLRLVYSLHGRINWSQIEDYLSQTLAISKDLGNLYPAEVKPLELDSLAIGVEKRDVKVIKRETYLLVSTLHRHCAELGRTKSPWFNTGLHLLFAEALIGLWAKMLEANTGAPAQGLENASLRIMELKRLVEQETGKNLPEVSLENPPESRLALYAWAEALREVKFDPGEELEKRLSQ